MRPAHSVVVAVVSSAGDERKKQRPENVRRCDAERAQVRIEHIEEQARHNGHRRQEAALAFKYTQYRSRLIKKARGFLFYARPRARQ